MYNYSPKTEKDFCYNANIITQYNNIDDRNYYGYYQNIALLLAIQIDMDQSKDFEDYIKANKVRITHQDAVVYMYNKSKEIK